MKMIAMIMLIKGIEMNMLAMNMIVMTMIVMTMIVMAMPMI